MRMWTQKYANSRCSLNSLHVLFIKTMLQLNRFSCYCRRQQHKFSSNMLHIMQYKCYNCWLLVLHTAFAADTSYCSAICCTLMLALPVKLLVLFQKKLYVYVCNGAITKSMELHEIDCSVCKYFFTPTQQSILFNYIEWIDSEVILRGLLRSFIWRIWDPLANLKISNVCILCNSYKS